MIDSITIGRKETLGTLRKGALFVTCDDVLAVKSEYTYDDGSQCLCILVTSGEYAHFPLKNETPVYEILITLEEENSDQSDWGE